MAISAVFVVFYLSLSILAQETTTGFTPLASKRFDYGSLPYQADTDNGVRGRQSGYNRCNSTTEGSESMCQTAIINSLDDFCLWGPPSGLTTIAETEHEEVAWCTKPGRGTRIIPANALQGVQFMRTSDYIQVVGYINQTLINLKGDDYGGELDPHGADLRGNPLGGLVYSNAWNNNSYTQVIEWHNFVGGNMFCFKACDPAGQNAARFCEHIYDRIGCVYNAPNHAQIGSFTSCEGENQDFPGVYTDSSGAVQTYTQPAESLGPIATIPYSPKVPASSNCATFQSTALYITASSTISGSSRRPTGTTTSHSSQPSHTTTGNFNSAPCLKSRAWASMWTVIAVAVLFT